MGIGLSGMISGLDTDSLIKQLMSAERTRVTKVDNKITKNEWTTEKWKGMNSKIYSLYTGTLSKMKTQGNYLTKKTTSSNDKVLSVKAGSSAPIGTHYVTVDAVASAQYVTGGKFTSAEKMNKNSKLTDAGVAEGTKITLTCGTKTKDFVVDGNSTFSDLSEACKSVGLNLNLDEERQCLYISSRQSGLENKFSITTSSENTASLAAKNDIFAQIDFSNLSDADKNGINDALATLKDSDSATISAILAKAENGETLDASEEKIKKAYDTVTEKALKNKADGLAKESVKADYVTQLKNAIAGKNGVTVFGTEYSEETVQGLYDSAFSMAKKEFENETFASVYSGVPELADVTYDKVLEISGKAATDRTAEEQAVLDAFEDPTLQAEFTNALGSFDPDNGYTGAGFADHLDRAITAYAENKADFGMDTADAKNEIETRKATIAADATNPDILAMKTALDSAIADYADTQGFDSNATALAAIGLTDLDGSAQSSSSNAAGMTVFEASDAKVTLNGATVTSSSNTVTMNGLTLNLLSAAPGETISVNVTQDTDSVYNMVKDFVKEYNDLLDEMNKAYYAESARGYEPLTDEQKDAMSDTEVEKWETKIKDSLLRRDTTLGSLIDAMRSVMNEVVNIDGKDYGLSSFGISTTKYSEKGKIHIYGNQDDPEGMTYEDKLRAAIEEDPDKVMEVLQGISKKLYDTMGDKMKATNLSSALTFYNDKQMTKDMTALKKEKQKEEDRLTQIEDRYYKQFASMEKALANLSSQSNSLLSMLGMQTYN